MHVVGARIVVDFQRVRFMGLRRIPCIVRLKQLRPLNLMDFNRGWQVFDVADAFGLKLRIDEEVLVCRKS